MKVGFEWRGVVSSNGYGDMRVWEGQVEKGKLK